MDKGTIADAKTMTSREDTHADLPPTLGMQRKAKTAKSTISKAQSSISRW